jgi:hypothetical protein
MLGDGSGEGERERKTKQKMTKLYTSSNLGEKYFLTRVYRIKFLKLLGLCVEEVNLL